MQLVSKCQLEGDQFEVQEWAHGFARDVIRPAAARNDRERLQPLDVPRSAFDVGLLTLAIPSEYGGGGSAFALTQAIVTEEGLAQSLQIVAPVAGCGSASTIHDLLFRDNSFPAGGWDTPHSPVRSGAHFAWSGTCSIVWGNPPPS